MAQQASFKEKTVLCFGDSLTAGYCDMGTKFVPYGDFLKEDLGCNVIVNGASGKCASDLLEQVNETNLCDVTMGAYDGLNFLLEQNNFDVAVILLGTNDLGYDEMPKAILNSISSLHSICHKRNIKTICVSIPESGFTTSVSSAKQRREDANKLLRKWAEDNDLVTYMECPVPFGKGEKEDGWDKDGLHMNAIGYRKLASGIQPVVANILAAV
eukprot:m.152398 g.152398  ORF g.152398 m.152398 type:complete len:213 (+) comp15054_c1_seq5:119-757(+)